MSRRKSSIYVDEDLWRKFKKYAVENGFEVSTLLEEIIREEIMDYVENALSVLAGSEVYELDFEPVKPREGLVSIIVREMRNGRSDSLSRY